MKLPDSILLMTVVQVIYVCLVSFIFWGADPGEWGIEWRGIVALGWLVATFVACKVIWENVKDEL